ncbi:MAG: sulfatase-like hydrolase/transferase, partial [Lentisphaeria bacterium]|nr:sulfatase-like hydrolase/transferase [Lentisphaeria bacterium]
MPSSARPNILLVQADQLRYDALGVTGNTLVRTPSIDRLAADGICFRNAFCAVPVCVPVRNSMLYGCWPSRHLCIGNSGTEAPRPPRPDLPTYDQVLRDAGYRLLRLGKIQEGQGPNDPGAFHACIPNSEYTHWRADQNLPPSPRTNGWFGEPDPAITPEQSRLGWGAGRIIDMLETVALDDEPFFIRWDTSEPHLPNIVPEPHASMIQPADVPPWPGFGDDLADKPYIQRQQLRTWGLEGWSWQQWAPTVARYLGEI